MNETGPRPVHRIRLVPCPGCGTATAYSPDNPFRPFCSERCKAGDFNAWAAERYRVDAPSASTDDELPPEIH